MKISKFSAIGRPVDPNYPTNRVIAIVTIAVMATGTFIQLLADSSLVQSLLWGLQAGLAVFLSWALGREIDPDNDLSAFVGATLTLFIIFIWGLPGLSLLLWSLLTLRIVNRTTGLSATVLDSLGFVGLGAWLTFQGNPGYGLLTVLALVFDGWIDSENRRQWLFAALATAATIAALMMGKATWSWNNFSWVAAGVALTLSILFLPVILGTRPVISVCDRTGERLDPLRVQVGQCLAALIGLEIVLWNGMSGLRESFPIWAVILGVILYGLFLVLAKKQGHKRSN